MVAPTDREFTNSIGMKLVRIEPGSFAMGHSSRLPDEVLNVTEVDTGSKVWLPENGDHDEQPAHKVTITRPFYMGVCEVTNEQYERFDPLHLLVRGKLGFSIDGDEAVVFVSWDDANAFCEWLSRKEGLPYRLPTEAEWEYACRAGTTTAFSTGDALPAEFLKNPSSSWYPHPLRGRGRQDLALLHVGKTPANPWGLHDMHGNVEEWCHDWHGPYAAGDQVDPVGRAEGDFRVTRGGSHSAFAYFLRSANRMGTLPQDQSWHIGFRVALGEMPATAPLPTAPPERFQLNVRQRRPRTMSKAPDPTQPYFQGPIPYVKIAEGSAGPLFARHNHDAAIVQCANGDLLAIWYTTVAERGRELAVAASRLRRGEQEWEPASLFWDAPDRNDHCPGLWFDGKRTLYHFNGLSAGATWGALAVIMRTSTDNGATWSRARLIMPEHMPRHMVIPGTFRAQDGSIVLPCDAVSGVERVTVLYLSGDQGQTWVDAGGAIAGIHAGVVQLRDGRLLAFGRGADINGKMPMSVSADMGKTWDYSQSPFPPIRGAQRLVLMRLQQGPILFVSFANEPIAITDASGKRRPVTGMFAALSYDECATWPAMRLVSDDGPGRTAGAMDGKPFVLSHSSAEPNGYLAACQGANGLIHLISSWSYYCFDLRWLATPAPPIEAAANR